MAGASYLFFLTVLLFFRGTIGVDNSINFINLLENYGLSLQTNISHQMEVYKTLGFSVGILLRSGYDTTQALDVQLNNPRYSSRYVVWLSFSCDDKGFYISSSGESNPTTKIAEVDFTCKNLVGFIVDVNVSNDGTKSKVSYTVKLCGAGGTVYNFPERVGGQYVYENEYVLTRVNVSKYGMGQMFFSDGIKFVDSPPGTSLTTFRPTFPLHTLKLQDESRTVIVRAFPEFIDDYAELQFQFYNSTTEKNVEKIFCLSVALNGTVLTIKESITGETILVLDGTRPDGILVQLFFSPNPRYEMNAYKNGDCIKTYAGEINGVSNRVVLTEINFDGDYETFESTYKLPEFQNARATVQAFHNSGLTVEPVFKRPIKFNGKFIFGDIVRRLPGKYCNLSFWVGFFRSVDVEGAYETNSRNLHFFLENKRSIVVDIGNKNKPGLDMSGMDGFTVELKMKNDEIWYTMTPYSGGQPFTTKRLEGVFKFKKGPTLGYDRLTISMRSAGNLYFDPKTEYVS